MARIFISHSTGDQAAAAELAARLRDWGYSGFFLDFDPEDGIAAGRDWEQELYRAPKASRAMIALCSERWRASRWCFAEVTQARSLGMHIFPVAIGLNGVDTLLHDLQVVDLTADPDAGYDRLRRGLSAAGLAPDEF